MEGLTRWCALNHRLDLIQHLVKTRGVQSYLEIGCADGKHVFDQVDVPGLKVGVDPSDAISAIRAGEVPGIGACNGTSDEYFDMMSHGPEFDLVFIDGLHLADQALRDVENSLQVLNPGGCIVLHDCNPPGPIAQKVPRPAVRQADGNYYEFPWTGDVWKAWVQLRTRHELDLACGDFDYGCGVILQRLNTDRLYTYPTILTYPKLEAYRQEWLRLMSPEELVEWLSE